MYTDCVSVACAPKRSQQAFTTQTN